jgi:hypothetical protein
MAVWFIMFETTFNNISAISWRFGLLCLKPLSTIFQLYHGGLDYYGNIVESGFKHNKPNRHDIAEIFLKVALNTINQTAMICL